MRKTLTIVTPTYNQCDYLEQCVESILPSLSSEIEYIIVNDGSTDKTEFVLQKYRNNPHIRVYTQKNIGQVRTLNRYWSESNAKYLTYVSSDDLVVPGGIDKIIKYATDHTELDVVYPDFFLIGADSKIIKYATNGDFSRTTIVEELVCQPGPLTIFKKSLFEKIGGWDPTLRISPDHDFWVRASNHGSIARFPEALAFYRVHEDSQSTGYMSIERAEEISRLAKKIRNQAPKGSINILKQISSAYYIIGCNHYKSNRYFRAFFWITLSYFANVLRKIM